MRSTWAALLSLASIIFAPVLPAIGQDVVYPSDPGVVTLDGGSTYGGSVPLGRGIYGYFRQDIQHGVGYRDGFSTIGGFAPLMLLDHAGFFGQGQLFVTDESNFGGNFGGGYRYYVESIDRVLSAYGFYDFDESFHEVDYDQIGIGFETLGPMWDFRLNGYFPLDSDEHFTRLNALTAPPVFAGNTIVFTGNALFEKPMPGVDTEIGVPLLDPSAFGRLRAYFGGYAYDGEQDDQIGGRVRLEGHLNEHVTLGAAFMHDDVNGDMVTMAVDIRGWSSVLPGLNNQQVSNRAKLFLPVVRQYRIANEQFLKNITDNALDQNGDPINIVWVDNSNPDAGDGTFENPFSSMPGSAPGANYILVREGDSTDTNPVIGGIALAGGQRMYGEGFDFSFDLSGSTMGPEFAGTYAIDTILPDWNTSGAHPFISNPGGDAIVLASGNHVAGFNIIDSAGNGVSGNGITDFNLESLTVGSTTAGLGNAGWGIALVNVSGVGTIEDIALHNNTAGGLLVDNLSTAALTLTVAGTSSAAPNVTGGNIGLNIIANNSTINADFTNFHNSGSADGMVVSSTNAANLNLAVTDGSFDDTTAFDGINLLVDGATLGVNFTDVTADNNATRGLDIGIYNAAVFTGAVTGTTLGGSSFSGNALNGIEVLVDNAAVVGNNLSFSQAVADGNAADGLLATLINGSSFTTTFNNGSIANNGDENVDLVIDNASALTVSVDPTDLSGAGEFGVLFNVFNGSTLNANFADVTILNSGLSGVGGIVDTASTANFTLADSLVNNSGEYGILINSLAGSTFNGTVSGSTINNNDQNAANAAGIGLVADTAAVLNLDVLDTGIANTAFGGTQNEGLIFTAANAAQVDIDLSGVGIFNSNSDGIYGEVHDAVTLADISLDFTTVQSSSGNGVNLQVDTGATLQASVSDASAVSANFDNGFNLDANDAGTIARVSMSGFTNAFDDNNLEGVRIHADGVDEITASVFGAASNNGRNGILFDIDNVNSIVDLSASSGFGDVSRNGFNGVAFDIADSTVNRINVSSIVAEGNGTGAFAQPIPSAVNNGVFVSLQDSTIAAGPGVTVFNSLLDGNVGSGLSVQLLNVASGDASDISISNNQFSSNGDDGFRFVNTDDVDAAADANINVAFDSNAMELNGDRGMNVLNRGDARTTLSANSNLVNENGQEGVFILNTASVNQSAAFGSPALSDGAANAVPRLDLTFNNNAVTANGANEDVDLTAGGFVLRVGTSDGRSFADFGDASFSDGGGFASDPGRGGVIATIDSNIFSENEGADVFFDSFVSAQIPVLAAPTAGTWSDQNDANAATDEFLISTYVADPLARLDLTFTNNSGDELEATQPGAAYSNSESIFKSRIDTLGTESAANQGPFSTATRLRNAQRLAFRDPLPPSLVIIGSTGQDSSDFLYSGLGRSTFRVEQFNNVFTGGIGFIVDVDPFTNPATHADGVDAGGADSAPSGGTFNVDFMPWGWSLLP